MTTPPPLPATATKTYLIVECPDETHALDLQRMLKEGSDGDYGFAFDKWIAEFGESKIEAAVPEKLAKLAEVNAVTESCGVIYDRRLIKIKELVAAYGRK